MTTRTKVPAGKPGDPLALFIASRGSRAMKWIVVIMTLALSATTAMHLVQYGTLNSSATPPFMVLLLCVIVLLWREQLRLAFEIFLWGMVALSLVSGFTVGGFQTPGLLLLPVVTTLSAWLLGPARTRLMLAISLVLIVTLAWQQSLGSIPVQTRGPFYWATVYAAVCIIGFILSTSMIASVREFYARSLSLSDELSALNQGLEDKVAQRTQELNHALDNLRRMQNDLIQAEKLASLGSTVAGIAHELNTPIGNAVTVISAMNERLKDLQARLADGTLKKSDLANGIASLVEMTALSDRSVNRAAALISSFKQVAIDQVSERRRLFDVRAVVHENLEALRPGLKNAPWQIDNQVPEGLQCDSFPGPLGQILVNLIQNAILHGFHQREHGRIEISARQEGDQLFLTVADDGVGMDTATTTRIFEPFFTTKLGKGGSGLGLAICYRIATTILAGELRTQSSPGTGTQFILRMPMRSPGKI